jgi:D-serine deaminase-like pyridoxal phosphate-dependent protein
MASHILDPLLGRSSNQERLNGPAGLSIEVDDHVFLRPTQSEFVMLHFGDLWVLQQGRLIARWPVFRQEA